MERTHDIHTRLKSTEIVIKWIMATLGGLVIGGIFIIRMRYDVDAHKSTIEDHGAAIRTLEHNDTVNAQKIDAIKSVVERIDRKLDK